MKRIMAALFGLGMVLGFGATDAIAQIDRSSAQERACQAKYDDIFANLNSKSPNKRRVTDEEISWAFDHEATLRDKVPCSLEKRPKTPAAASAPASQNQQTAAVVEAGGSTNALAGQAAYNSGDFATARAKYDLGCFSEGNAAACNNLGSLAYKGQGGSKDLVLARRAFQQGCAKGVPESCGVYGSFLKKGDGGPKDAAAAIAPLSTACNAKRASGCYDLGTIYFYGQNGKAPDLVLARKFLAQSCPGYAADGCYGLALLQRDGKGGPVDAAGAVRSFELSCKAGKSDGCLEFGVAQYTGAGIAQDQAGARASFTKACNTGNAGACMNAGMMARDGQGGSIDAPAAKRLFGLGCKLGVNDGCVEAGRMGV